MPLIRSRIHQYINKELMEELKSICLDVRESNNNVKVARIRETLDKHNVPYSDLGPGTNRMAVLIDGYVFKIAMDTWGVRDNDNEFAMTEILQPFVINVYETNGLISVSEYVTLISREEFAEKKNEILKILHTLSQGFLLGDVGYHPKNFTNWGYRTNGDLVILDFAYIYNIVGDEMLCSNDGHLLQYDENFHNLRCPYCRKRYTFIEIRRKVTREVEDREINAAKQAAYAVTTESTFFMDKDEEDNKEETKEEKDMEHGREFSEEKRDELLEEISEMFVEKKITLEEEVKVGEKEIKIVDESEKDPLDDVVNLMDSVYKDGIDEECEDETEEEDVEDSTPVNPLETFLIANGYDPESGEDEEDKVEVEVIATETKEVRVTAKVPVQEAFIVEEPQDEESEEPLNSEPLPKEVLSEDNETQDEECMKNTEKDSSGLKALETLEEKFKDMPKIEEDESEPKQLDMYSEEINGIEEPDCTEEEKPSKPKAGIRVLSKGSKEELKEKTKEEVTEVKVEQTTETTIRRLVKEDQEKAQEEIEKSSDETSATTAEAEESVAVNEEEDLFASAIQQARQIADDSFEEEYEQDEIDKYEELAEQHLGRDPYDY